MISETSFFGVIRTRAELHLALLKAMRRSYEIEARAEEQRKLRRLLYEMLVEPRMDPSQRRVADEEARVELLCTRLLTICRGIAGFYDPSRPQHNYDPARFDALFPNLTRREIEASRSDRDLELEVEELLFGADLSAEEDPAAFAAAVRRRYAGLGDAEKLRLMTLLETLLGRSRSLGVQDQQDIAPPGGTDSANTTAHE